MLDEYAKESAFKEYVTDALKAIADNTSRYVTFNGVVETGVKVSKRYADIICPKVQEKDETASDIINRIRAKCDDLKEN